MKFIDAQMHIWPADTPAHPWVPGAHSHGAVFSAEQALGIMDANSVQSTVLVTPSWVGSDNSCGLEAAVRYPGRFFVMGRFDYTAADRMQRLDHWRDQPGMLGIRATLADPLTISVFQDRAFHAFWERCAELGLPLMCYPPQVLPLVQGFARSHPGLRITVDHAGRFARGPKDAAAWTDLPDLLALASLPNVAVKVSSLPAFSTLPYPFPGLHAPIRAIHDCFGPERMMWGSDVTRLEWPYADNIRLFTEALDFLGDDDREWLFWRALTRWVDVPA